MAKKTSGKKKTSGRKKTTRKKAASRGSAPDATGKQLVIVESPSKARTINKYLGDEYVVLASVGHVRDLPSRNPKGVKNPVPGVDLEKDFSPTYEVSKDKDKTIKELKKAAKQASEVWFATDLDREGEAIAWHLAEELGVKPEQAKRVIFSAITREEIQRAFAKPHSIDMDRVNAQQARRILDRIVGYQVSPLLWKKVARGLSAGRVQSVAVRLVVEREREIQAFVPDEYWQVSANFALTLEEAEKLGPAWMELLGKKDEKGKGPTVKSQNAWLGEHKAIKAELIEVGGESFKLGVSGQQKDGAFEKADAHDITGRVQEIAQLAGMYSFSIDTQEDPKGKGPGRWKRTVTGSVDPKTLYKVDSISTKRTTSRPPPPFITSTLQQAASSRLGFAARRTMRTAQGLYEGVNVPGEGPVGLITYMRTDSTHLAPGAVQSARNYIEDTFGHDYLPEKPNFFSSSNKSAQEAHEAIRPTSLAYPPSKVKKALNADQFKLYTLIWERFLACQMVPAQWDSTTVLIKGGTDEKTPLTFKASGRVLVFDGFYRASGVPTGGDQAVLPRVEEKSHLHPFWMEPQQKFTAPPSRYSEASLIKVLEAEGIGRPSTYASIIQVIQDRRYVEQLNKAFYATDLGEVVTDMLMQAFPKIMDVGYTRDMEGDLDKVEDEHLDWVQMLHRFYGPFKDALEHAEENLAHAKSVVTPAPKEYRCEQCGSDLVYRFGKNGKFLSCSNYPECKYACPIDREGRPKKDEFVNVKCPKTGRAMVKKTGRFGPFITTVLKEGESQDVGLILNIDKKLGKVKAPSVPPLMTDLECAKCGRPLALRSGVRGPWLGCSGFPKCRGRGKWAELEDEKKAQLEEALEAHEKANPIPVIETLDGKALTDIQTGKPLGDAPTVEELTIDDPSDVEAGSERSVA